MRAGRVAPQRASVRTRRVRARFTPRDRSGQRRKTVLSQRDVPGISRAVLPVLAANGVRAVTVGVNGASTPPNVPRIYNWQDPVSGVTMLAMTHPGGYGGIALEDAVIVPGARGEVGRGAALRRCDGRSWAWRGVAPVRRD